MQNITNISVEILKVHPRNTEFFDDISGAEYERFKKSIQEDGVLSPILVAPDMTIISGHQRVKACIDVGIKLVPVMIREDLTEEDEKLKILLSANFGRLKNNEAKQRKVALEYVNLCGLKNGEKLSDNRKALTQDEIANQLGLSITALGEMLAIERKLTPEMKELIDTGAITKTTASKLLTKLSQAEQEELIQSLDVTKKLTQKEVQKYVDKVKELESMSQEVIEIDKTDYFVSEKNKKLISDIENLKRENSNLSSLNRTLTESKMVTERISDTYKEQSEEYMSIKSKIIDMGSEPDSEYNLYGAASEIAKLTKDIEDFLLNKLAPVKYKNFMIAVKNSDVLRKNFINTLELVEEWYSSMMDYVNADETEKNKIINMEEI